MTPKEFEKSITTGDFRSYYIFSGPEELKKKQALDLVRKSCLPEGLEMLNETTLENCTVSDIIDNAILLPVMCDRRILVIRDWAPFLAPKKEGDSKDSSGKKDPSSDSRDQMREWLKQAPDSCVIIFVCSRGLSRALDKDPGIVKFDYLTGDALFEECNSILTSSEKQLRRDAFEELTLMAGTDLTHLTSELEKLSAYTGKNRNITIADVRAAVTPSPEYTVFNILDQLLDDNIGEATRVLNNLLKQPSVAPVYIIAMFISSLRVYYLLKLASDNGTLNETCTFLKVTDGRKNYVLRRFKYVSAQDLQKRYDYCTRADAEIKSGRANDRATLDLLMQKVLLHKRNTSAPRR